MGSDFAFPDVIGCLSHFNPRSPHGERLDFSPKICLLRGNFNPRSPHGERLTAFPLPFVAGVFQSTLPAWGATDAAPQAGAALPFQSTLPAWGATAQLLKVTLPMVYFNPRSPHGERPADTSDLRERSISIHAPRMGSDSTVKAYSNDRIKWSTLREPHFLYSKNAYFSPIVSMCATTSRTKKSENQSFIRIISRLGTYVFHLRLVSIPQIIEPYAVRLLVHQHFQCGTK